MAHGLRPESGNTTLRAYYERAGSRHVDDVPVPKWSTGRPLISRYERPV